MVHDTDIVELELKSKRFSLAVRKKEALESSEPAPMAYQVLTPLLFDYVLYIVACHATGARALLRTHRIRPAGYYLHSVG